MFGFAMPAAVAALMIGGTPMPGVSSSRPASWQPAPALMADSARLASSFNGRQLDLTMRGATVEVMARAAPAEAGCAASLEAQAPGRARSWTRLLRWGDVAWQGEGDDGRVIVAFYEPEGRLPADVVTFTPRDAQAFRETLERVSQACRGARAEGDWVLAAHSARLRSCFFARLPGLQLIDSAAPQPLADPPRAMLTVLSRETPEAELQLLVERGAPDTDASGDDWAAADVAFTIATPAVRGRRIVTASFALDAQPVATRHSIAAYGDTRLRIRMDDSARRAAAVPAGGFYTQLAGSSVVSVTLADEARRSARTLHFDAGAAMAAARSALRAADWSCNAAQPAPEPAARWQPAG